MNEQVTAVDNWSASADDLELRCRKYASPQTQSLEGWGSRGTVYQLSFLRDAGGRTCGMRKCNHPSLPGPAPVSPLSQLLTASDASRQWPNWKLVRKTVKYSPLRIREKHERGECFYNMLSKYREHWDSRSRMLFRWRRVRDVRGLADVDNL